MKDYSEKRDFHRMQVESEIEITDSKGGTFAGTCRDLSATGMQLFVRNPVMVGEELSTVLHPSGDQFPRWRLSVRLFGVNRRVMAFCWEPTSAK